MSFAFGGGMGGKTEAMVRHLVLSGTLKKEINLIMPERLVKILQERGHLPDPLPAHIKTYGGFSLIKPDEKKFELKYFDLI